jgi:regulator of sigma E protease
VGSVAAGSPAERAGLLPGDEILSVAGRPVPTWEQFYLAVLPKANRETMLIVRRGGTQLTKMLTPEAQTKYEFGYAGVLPIMRPQVLAVTPGDPAIKAGVRTGDVIVALNGERGLSREQLIERIRVSAGKPVTLTILRDNTQFELSVKPKKSGEFAIIGAQLSEAEFKTIEPGPLEAVSLSFQKNWEWTKLIFKTLAGLFTRETSVKQLMGPVAIAELSGDSARLGWMPLFSLMAMISLNLGLLNLMPIPVLDGGHITIMALEGLARRDFSMRVKEKMLLGGFVVLMALMVTVIYNDLTRVQWIERLMPWR